MKFNIGDRVQIVGARYPKRRDAPEVGAVVQIIGAPKPFPTSAYPGLWYPIDVDKWWVAEIDLKPIYDGNEKVEWSSCVWQPKEIRVC